MSLFSKKAKEEKTLAAVAVIVEKLRILSA